MDLKRLLTSVAYTRAIGDLEAAITGITCDSRQVKKDNLFVAIAGEKHDGHDYIPEAISKGAIAVVGERDFIGIDRNVTYITVANSRQALADLACTFYAHPTESLFTVGVTGTNGKTSVTYLVQSVLGEEKTELINTIVNALKRNLLNTTPDPLEIQRIAYEALASKKENLVLEVSAHALSQERVRGVDFDVAIFTNLTQDHFDYYHGWEDYLQAKLKLFSGLKKEGLAIINRDDPTSQFFKEKTKGRVLTYGRKSYADLWASDIKLKPDYSHFKAYTPSGKISINTRLPGEFYIYNILAAIGVGIIKDIPLARIKERIESIKHIEGRFERFQTKNGFHIVIDFAHSPDSLQRMIAALKPFYKRVITVFGCGGESDRLKRPLMGKISGSLSDYTIITSDNPKGEDPQTIIQEIEEGLKDLTTNYETIVDRPTAIIRALQIAKAGDVILIAGKGHEQTQIFKDKEIEYNDKEFLKKIKAI